MLDNPDPNKQIGGLGDRIGGLLTAFIFALRNIPNRKFIIMCDDEGLKKAFQPYKNAIPIVSHNVSITDLYDTKDILDLSYCINPDDHYKQQDQYSNISFYCHLHYYNPPQKIILLQLNRAYLCQWAIHKDLPAYSQLQHLGITDSTDLFEFAGCALRLLFWPTTELWKDTLDILNQTSTNTAASVSSNELNAQYLLVSIHYRCGDGSFNREGVNSQCVEMKGRKWLRNQESPVVTANCASNMLYWYKSLNISSLIYISSDSEDSSTQIRSTLRHHHWQHIITAAQSCHIDYAQNDPTCSYNTAISWFILGLSHHVFTTSLTHKGYTYSAPQSGFSRYATLYTLETDALRLARSCRSIERVNTSRQHIGNWWCYRPEGLIDK